LPKILLAIDGRAWGGAETVVAQLASGLAERGHQVTLWTSKKGGCQEIFKKRAHKDVKIQEVPLLNDGDIFSMVKFHAALRKYDIVHVHLSHAAVLSMMAARFLPAQYRRKLLCHFHGTLANPKHYKNHSQGVCVSKTVERYVNARMPWIRTHQVYNGVDMDAAETARPLLPPSGKIRIGYLARMSEKKGQADLIKAVKGLGSLSEKVELFLGGEGKFSQDLKKMAAESGIAERVRFFGFIPPEQVFPFWKSVDIACFPTYGEGFSISVLEAMASGLPVVAYDDPAVMEAMGESGFAVPVGDIGKLGQALGKMIQDRGKRSELGGLALSRSKRFTTTAMVEGMEKVYRSIIDQATIPTEEQNCDPRSIK
jgi:glycosyltransferase involved in cell wall biosynthesis